MPPTMEGFLDVINPKDRFKKKKMRYFKLDVVSARLLYFKDATQANIRGSVVVTDADVYTPALGEINHGVSIDSMPYCFVIVEGKGNSGRVLYLNSEDETSKRKWMNVLFKYARSGPQKETFSTVESDQNFMFEARVFDYRILDRGYVEYRVSCKCRFVSRSIAKRLSKTWDIWHRFSVFSDLDHALRKTLGYHMKDIHFPSRGNLKFVIGNKLDVDFVEQRRVGLDKYISQICTIRTAVEFLKHHCSPQLKIFFDFDVQTGKPKADSSADLATPREDSKSQHRSRETNGGISDKSAQKHYRHQLDERVRDTKEECDRERERRRQRRKEQRVRKEQEVTVEQARERKDEARAERRAQRKEEKRRRNRQEAPPFSPPVPTEEFRHSTCQQTQPPQPPLPGPSLLQTNHFAPKPVNTDGCKSMNPGGASAPSNRGDLLAQIQLGMKLKKTETNDKDESMGVGRVVEGKMNTAPKLNHTAQTGGDGLESGGFMSSLQAALDTRTGKLVDTTADSNSDDDDWK